MKDQLKVIKWIFSIFFMVYIILFTILMVTSNYYIMIIQVILAFIGIFYSFINIMLIKKKMYKSVSKFIDNLGLGKQNIINNLQLPMIIVNSEGQII